MTIHHVDVDHASARRQHLLDLRTKAGEVGGEDRWRNPALPHDRRDAVPCRRIGPLPGGAHTALSMLPWQWLQATEAVLDMRTIVECSPQLGHTEVSSYRRRHHMQR